MPTIPRDQGAIRNYNFAAPAPGANFSATPLTNQRWRPIAIQWQVVTDATVANRQPYCTFNPDGTLDHFLDPELTQAASLSRVFSASSGYNGSKSTLGSNRIFCLPPGIVIGPGGYFTIQVINIQAGDQINLISLTVEEWIEP